MEDLEEKEEILRRLKEPSSDESERFFWSAKFKEGMYPKIYLQQLGASSVIRIGEKGRARLRRAGLYTAAPESGILRPGGETHAAREQSPEPPDAGRSP